MATCGFDCSGEFERVIGNTKTVSLFAGFPNHPIRICRLCHYHQVFIVGGPIDYMRLATLSSFGFIYHGPSGHYFYNWLDEIIPGTEAVHVFSKVAVDQLFWCPIFMSVFFTYLGLVNGDSFATIGNKIKTDLFNACQGSWKVWPMAHFINFKFVSNKWRIPYINAVQIAFNIFLSLLGTKTT
jgi:protein Mpv17